MTVYEAVKKGIEYIEAHLQGDISVWDVANAVNYSQFYFSRQFSIHTHTSIYEYILKRKLTESYRRLFSGKPRIVDLAVGYGFSSHEVYSRAFRKMFGENPSEAAVYKPLLLYEPIDEDYLHFLCGLKIDRVGAPADDCFFETDSVADLSVQGSLLVLLSGEHRLSVKCMMQGRITDGVGTRLCFGLCGLKHKIRIHHGDARYCLRYYFDHFHDPATMASNYIVLRNDQSRTDILVPE